MSFVHISRVKSLLESQVFQYIDIDKIKQEKTGISDEQLENICLTQSYLLFALRNITELDYSQLSDCIVDNYKDNGLDAIYYSRIKNTLYVCQSKFNKKGACTVNKGETLKFLEGVNDLLSLDFSKFNDKVNLLKDDIIEAIYSVNIKIEIVIVHTGNHLSTEIQDLLQEKIKLLNDTDEIIFLEEYSLVRAYENLKASVTGEPINMDIDLINWGINKEPYRSYYGTVNCGLIAELAQNNPKRLFSKNLRSFIGINSINNDIVKSIIDMPEYFFYLNNGIVLLCNGIVKSPYNSGKREIGKFNLIDVSVINGAQTVGAIKYAFSKQPDKVNNANVFVKIISLENTPNNFDKLITIASNTQNRIEKRDFISLDELQNKLVNEFFLNNMIYHIKRDDLQEKKDDKNFYFEEATIALAGFQDNVDYSTYAKREIGKLWEDERYNEIFNKDINIFFLVNIIKVFREIENYIKTLEEASRHICLHGIYLISNIVYTNQKKTLLNPNLDVNIFIKNEFKQEIRDVCKKIVTTYETSKFSQNRIPLSVFKNFKICREIKDNVTNATKVDNAQANLFDLFPNDFK